MNHNLAELRLMNSVYVWFGTLGRILVTALWSAFHFISPVGLQFIINSHVTSSAKSFSNLISIKIKVKITNKFRLQAKENLQGN